MRVTASATRITAPLTGQTLPFFPPLSSFLPGAWTCGGQNGETYSQLIWPGGAGRCLRAAPLLPPGFGAPYGPEGVAEAEQRFGGCARGTCLPKPRFADAGTQIDYLEDDGYVKGFTPRRVGQRQRLRICYSLAK